MSTQAKASGTLPPKPVDVLSALLSLDISADVWLLAEEATTSPSGNNMPCGCRLDCWRGSILLLYSNLKTEQKQHHKVGPKSINDVAKHLCRRYLRSECQNRRCKVHIFDVTRIFFWKCCLEHIFDVMQYSHATSIAALRDESGFEDDTDCPTEKPVLHLPGRLSPLLCLPIFASNSALSEQALQDILSKHVVPLLRREGSFWDYALDVILGPIKV